MSLCVMEGCSGVVHGRGWCKAHYLRWRRHGNPLAGSTFRHRGLRCEVNDCERLADSHGLCQFHRRRWQRFGDPLAGGVARPQSGSRTDTPTYRTVHARVTRWRGTPRICERCGTTTGRRYEWALREDAEEIRTDARGRLFSRLVGDYIRLCKKCHCAQDKRVRDGFEPVRT
jgi:hypothetical protein